MTHDFKKFPELTNNQMTFYYWDSPHKQIYEDITCKVTRIIDGDTFEVEWYARDFLFPVRMSNIAAPELGETGGRESASWLESRILGKEVALRIDRFNRVGKFGRLLARVELSGVDIGIESASSGMSLYFGRHVEEDLGRATNAAFVGGALLG